MPSLASTQNIIKKFKETGSIADLPRPGATKKITDEKKTQIQAIFENSTKKTLTQISAEVGVARSTCYSYIRKELCVRSFKIQIHQGLHFEDHDLRVQSAEKLLPYLQNPMLNDLIFFSDEATFHISGRVHKQNCRIWSTENPHEVQEYWDKSTKINVWCAMSSNCIIGPYFFEENVNGQNYLKMLKEFSGHKFKICADARRFISNKMELQLILA